MKILIMGLPGAGKTTLAEALARELQCVHFNADEIRREINKDLGFSPEDRLEQARRMGVLCNIVSRYGAHVIADFVCPLPETREAFGAHFTVWVDRIKEGRFEDTNKMFVPPTSYDYRVTSKFDYAVFHAQEIANVITGKRKKLTLG
jgi:adenylylsulfate kinase